MIATWSRRAALLAAGAALSLLAGCGASTTASALAPTRIISFGDAFSDVGQQAGNKYTVNDGSVNNWLNELATPFGLTITPSSSGGTGYARGLARINSATDAAGNTGTLNVTQQIDAFLTTGSFGPNDLVFINGGASDIVAEMNAVTAGLQTQAQMQSNVQNAGNDLANQVIRLVDSGANYVVVLGTHNLGQTPWATAIGQNAVLTTMSTKFNEAMLVPIVAMGKHVLYVDATYYLNLVSNPLSAPYYGLTNAVDPVCTSVDVGTGIGIGTDQVNSLLCTATTVVSGANIATYTFADRLNFTPVVQRLFGDYAYARVRARW
jgi:phospholipase/lecithinase/hemolysin